MKIYSHSYLIKKYKKNFCKIFIYGFPFFTIFYAKAEETQTQKSHNSEKNATERLNDEGISKKIEELKSQNESLDKAYFTFGIYKEKLNYKTRDNYEVYSPGVFISYTQKLKSIWNGSIEARWSNWSEVDKEEKQNTSSVKQVSPLTILSKISVIPEKYYSILNLGIKPVANVAFGYTFFFDKRSLYLNTNKTNFTEAAFSYGVGVNLKISDNFGITTGIEHWIGLNSSKYNIEQYYLGVIIGSL